MAMNPTPSGVTAGTADAARSNPNESMRADVRSPVGKITRGGLNVYWSVAAIILLALALAFVFMKQGPATMPPAAQSIGKSDQAKQPVPVTPTQPTPTAPTQP